MKGGSTEKLGGPIEHYAVIIDETHITKRKYARGGFCGRETIANKTLSCAE